MAIGISKRVMGAGLVAMSLAMGLSTAVGAETTVPDSLAAIVDRAMATGLSPGMSVAVVQGARVVWVGARGMADREANRPVTPATRFYIASTTKALTALAAAKLAARGALNLEAPLSAAFPGVRFHPGLAPDSIRVVDLLTHTHGIDPDGPVSLRVTHTGEYTNADLLRVLSAHGPARGGRAFDYSNFGYELVGLLLDPVETRGWKRVVEREVTGPLGMTSTTAYRSKVPESELAMPYLNSPQGFERVRLSKQDENMGPAGGHFSTASDLARLLVAELNAGRVDGRECVPAEVIAGTQRARVPRSGGPEEMPRFGWGLGWDLGTYQGDTLVHRPGTYSGFYSHVSFMPAHGVGVVVLVNGGTTGRALADIVVASLYDRLLGRPGASDRLAARLDELVQQVNPIRQSIAADRARRAARSQQLPHPLEAYAGEYASPEWGTLSLAVREGRLEARLGVAASAVEVFDATRNRLRVELFDAGTVLEALFETGDTRARGMRMGPATFGRR